MSLSGTPLVTGTFVFILLGVLGCSGSWFLHRKGENEYHSLAIVLITTATICCWMMWFMTWLMQWHPILLPEKS